ncbi:MAG: type 1 glutamine amidotransferase domain-containing protein [Endomicrobiales bacterium]|jgi:protease I
MATIAALVGDMFEDSEYQEPVKAFKSDGHDVIILSENAPVELHGERGRATISSDKAVKDVSIDDFDALFIPGGYSPDKLRIYDDVVSFVRDFVNSGKPVFTICHAPQLLVTADVLKGRSVAGWKSLKQDITNAGAKFVDREVVEDGNLISSRSPADIPAFNKASLNRLSSLRTKQSAVSR